VKRTCFQALVAVTVVLLALPQGWCCLVPRMLPKPKDAEAACCCCHVNQTAPEQKDKSPEPAEPFACCCEPRLMAADQGAWDQSFEMPAAILTTFEDWFPTSTLVAFDSSRSGESGGPPLHVLLCVWRC